MSISKKEASKNFFYSIFSQLLTLTMGIVIPRLVLVSYGSEINGLLNTISQIFVYIGLLEAGIGNASVNVLYKPIAEKNRSEISDIVSATQQYYWKISGVYVLAVIAFALLFPYIVVCELSNISIFWIVIFQGLSGVLTFCFIASYKQLLIADGKNYIIQNINLVINTMNYAAKIVLIAIGVDVVFIQFVFMLITCCQVFAYQWYIKKKYPWLCRITNPNMEHLSQRSAFLVHEISGAIFSSTDVFVLSTFCSLKVASVYSVYNLVFSAINALISAINNGLHYILGQTYMQDKSKYIIVHDIYDSLYMALVFSLFTVAYVMIIPFVELYTKGVSDIVYVDKKLPILFAMIQFLSCSRGVATKLITVAGHARATQKRSIAETVINLSVSLLLVNVIGIYGVLLGTIVALLYRANDIIIYANTKILKRKPWKTYSKFIFNICIFFSISWVYRKIADMEFDSYVTFFAACIVNLLTFSIVYFSAAVLVNKKCCSLIKSFFKKNNV